MTHYRQVEDPFNAARNMIHAQTIRGFFSAEERFKAKVIDDLVERNNKELRWPSPPNCFQFRTTIYRHSSCNSFNGVTKFPKGIPVIHQSLEAEMIKLVAGWERIEFDKQKLKQILSILLKPCVNIQQARDAVPEFLVRHCAMLTDYPRRTQPFELESRLTPAQWEDYNRILPRLHIYNGAAMLI